MNGNAVYKASPEELATIANIASLVDELRAMGAGGAAAAPAGDTGQGAGEENIMASQNQQGAQPQNPIAPAGPAAPAAAPKPPRDEDNTAVATAQDPVMGACQKAASIIRKAMTAENDNSDEANVDAEDRIQNNLADDDEQQVKEVAKALYGMVTGRKVAKSAPSARVGAPAQDDGNQVVKALLDRLDRQDAVLAEVLEGLGAVPPAPAAAAAVQKSQGDRRPVAGYDQGADFIDALAEAVVRKSSGQARVGQNAAQEDEFGMPVNKSLREFTGSLGSLAGGLWGQH